MTYHTYRVIWPHDVEADDEDVPGHVQAAQEFMSFALELGRGVISDDDRPVLEVRQFVDDDKPPLCVKVDTLDWSMGEFWYDIGATR